MDRAKTLLWLLELLECPRDHSALHAEDETLRCEHGHEYPIIEGVPVLLVPEADQTIGIATASLAAVQRLDSRPLFLDTVGISDEQRQAVARQWTGQNEIDPVIAYLIGATSGHGYLNQIGKLQNYPIPDIPVDEGRGGLLLDLGASWCRWSVSAARKGWKVVSIDPSLGALLAAKRAFSESGLELALVCGDARFLPFRSAQFHQVFSYSVLQHFSQDDAQAAIGEAGRVLRQGGSLKVQMAHSGGFRSRYVESRRRTDPFRVRYWSLAMLHDVFERNVGPTKLRAEAFGGLGLLFEDRSYVSIRAKLLIYASHFLKTLSIYVPQIIRIADSVYVVSQRVK